MKNLGRTINQILKAVPDLKGPLSPIRTKWKRNPDHAMEYWKEMLDILNSDNFKSHPQYKTIHDIVISTVKRREVGYTFSEASEKDNIVGIIPENISDRIKRYDRAMIRIVKQKFESEATSNIELRKKALRTEAIHEINLKKVWLELKDHFRIWAYDSSYSLTIKKQRGVLILVADPMQPHPSQRLMFPPINLDDFRRFLEGGDQ